MFRQQSPRRPARLPRPQIASEGVSLFPRPHAPSVAFENVTFAYPGRKEPALDRVSFMIGAGESVAVVGPSGAGKSTLANLLLRFWEYGSGDIRLGGKSLRSLDPDSIRAQIGYVSQHSYFFDTSVLENLRLARRGTTRAQVEQAAIRARLHDFILTLPQGYDAFIGEHGARLSAGERQRMAIARLMLKEAPILILDEPTANLDAATENDLLEALFEIMSSRTCLYITHRLAGMQHFRRILVMNHGLVQEHGTHTALLATGGLYNRLWTLQNGSPDAAPGALASTV